MIAVISGIHRLTFAFATRPVGPTTISLKFQNRNGISRQSFYLFKNLLPLELVPAALPAFFVPHELQVDYAFSLGPHASVRRTALRRFSLRLLERVECGTGGRSRAGFGLANFLGHRTAPAAVDHANHAGVQGRVCVRGFALFPGLALAGELLASVRPGD